MMTWTRRDHWTSAWLRGGEITQAVWVDKQVLAWSSGVHLVFYDVSSNNASNTASIYSPNPSEADGVCCLAGKPSLQLLAFAEQKSTPSILVFKYPEMKLVSKCEKGEFPYLSIAFAKDYLISVTSFTLMVWSWRTGEKLSRIETSCGNFENQMIRVAETRPISVAQLGERLLIWKLFSSGTVMAKEEVVLPSEMPPVYVDWSSDSDEAQLAIVDMHGHVYIRNKEEVTRVVFSQRCGVCLEYEVPSVCWFLDGLMLKTTFCQMRFFKKNQKNVWRRQQYVKSEHKPRFFLPHSVDYEKLFYFTKEGFLMELKVGEKITNNVKFKFGGIYQFVDFVHPWDDHVAAIEGDRLSIMSIADGNEVGALDFDPGIKISSLKSHLDFPLLAITFYSGELVLAAVHAPDRPALLFKFHLQRRKLDFAKFSACGRHVVAANASGNCFCVSSDQNLFSKVDHLKMDKFIMDVNCCEVEGTIKILALVLTSHKSGHLLAIYRLPDVFERVIELPKAYQSLDFTGNGLKLVGTPYLSKEIHFFRLQESGLSLTDCSGIEHQLRHLRLTANRFCITAAGSDGLITILSGDSRVTLLSHHRKDLGVSGAICSVSKDSVIALGRSGSLVCLKTTVRGSKRNGSLYNYLSARPIYQILSQECQVVPANGHTWLEWSTEWRKLKEEEDWREERLLILREFKELKDKIKEMLDANQEVKEVYQLLVAAFDIARSAREQKIKAAKEECEDVKLQIEFECKAMDKVAAWITERFRDALRVKGKTLRSFSDTYAITNYPSMEDPGEEVLEWIDELGSSVKMDVNTRINSLARESKRYSLVKSRYKSNRDEKSVIESLMIDEEEEDEEVRREEERASIGTTTSRFIQTYFQQSQFENYSFQEFLRINQRLLEDLLGLEEHFNGMFQEMWDLRGQKALEIAELKAKLEFINEEIETIFGKTLLGDWKEDLVAEESEAGDDGLDSEAARSRLTDEFREKTIAMMDGVKVRWEDLKKEVPILKSPENHQQEVLEKIEKEAYALNFLKENYRRVLESDFQKTYKTLQETIFSYDERCKDFLMLKIKIDAAIGQINLLRIRGMIRFVKRFELMKKIEKVEESIVERQELVESLLDLGSKMRNLISKLKKEREDIEEEDSEFSKKVRKEMVGKFGKEVFEVMKKNLKVRFSVKGSAEEFRGLAKAIRVGELERRLEYLGDFDNLECLELMEKGVPEFISPEQRDCFVGLRRKKVEMELRLRANSIELSEIEKGVGDNKIKVRRVEADVGELKEQILRLNEKLIDFDLDIEIQLVIEKRQVEINLCGVRDDAKNSNLMPRDQVEQAVKEVIVAAEGKLKALQKVMAFNRILIMKEWKHGALKKEMLDFADELQDVKTFVVTKDIRMLLERKLKEKTPQKLARGVTAMKKVHEKALKQVLARVQAVEDKIKSVKKNNAFWEKKIARMNGNLEGIGDMDIRKPEVGGRILKIKILMKRSELTRIILKEYAELEALKNEYRVQCQKTIPFFDLINDC